MVSGKRDVILNVYFTPLTQPSIESVLQTQKTKKNFSSFQYKLM